MVFFKKKLHNILADSEIVLFIIQVSFMISWIACKKFKEIKVRASRAYVEEECISNFNNKKIEIKCYVKNIYGLILYWFYIFCASILFLFLFILCLEEYLGFCKIEKIYSHHEIQKESLLVFVVVWIFTLLWCFLFISFSKNLKGFFMVECDYYKTELIQVSSLQPQKDLDNFNWLLRFFKKSIIYFKRMFKLNYDVIYTKMNRTETGYFYFDHQHTRFVYNTEENAFKPFKIAPPKLLNEIFNSKGLTHDEALLIVTLKGPNSLQIDLRTKLDLFFEEIASLFYVYQTMTLWIFIRFKYYQIGFLYLSIIPFAIVIKIIIRKNATEKIKLLVKNENIVEIFVDQRWTEALSQELVPGDLIRIKSGSKVPADIIILSGIPIVDESSLTGESSMIVKFPIKEEAKEYDMNGRNRPNTLFSGTSIFEINLEEYVIGFVYETGVLTEKGKAIGDILYMEIEKGFFEDFALALIVSFIFSSLVVIINCTFFNRLKIIGWYYNIIYSSMLINPLLQVELILVQIISCKRINKNIHCIHSNKMNIAGKIKFFCFDKTGTLTKSNLEFLGAYDLVRSTVIYDFDSLSYYIKLGMTVCHSVTNFNHIKIGNPVDIEMLKASNFEYKVEDETFIENIVDSDQNRFMIVKKYEFVYSKSYMSSVVLDCKTNILHLFSKGSYNAIMKLIRKNESTNEFKTQNQLLESRGNYTIVMAHKNLGYINRDELDNIDRDLLENNMDILGTLLFINKLKDDTSLTIKILKNANIRPLMITGDNVMTGIYISKLCGMMNENGKIYLAESDPRNFVKWKNIQTSEYSDTKTILILSEYRKDIELIITHEELDILIINEDIHKLISYIRIFARMTPKDKLTIVKLLKKCGIVAMCGDGSNDAGALREADIGLAIENSEASLISSFSTKENSIEPCLDLIRYGKHSLDTSIVIYKYLLTYGAMAIISTIPFNLFPIKINDYIWMFVDTVLVILIPLSIILTKPKKMLTNLLPTYYIFSNEVLFSLFGQAIIYSLSFILAHFAVSRYHKDAMLIFDLYNEPNPEELENNYESQTITFVFLFQMINCALSYNFGLKFRKSWYYNYPFLVLYCCCIAFVSLLLLTGPNKFTCFFNLNCVYESEFNENKIYDTNLRYLILTICIFGGIISLLWERFIVKTLFSNKI